MENYRSCEVIIQEEGINNELSDCKNIEHRAIRTIF